MHYFKIGLLLALLLAGAAAYLTREHWLPEQTEAKHDDEDGHGAVVGEITTLKMSAQARKNIGLIARPMMPQKYARSIEIPGVIIDRPGYSDRGVPAPAVGVVTRIYAFPGDTVKPGEKLFTLRLFSEFLQNSQSELFKATRESQITREALAKAENLVKAGVIPESKLLELEQQSKRLGAAIQGYRQDLLTRGLKPEQIDGIGEGKFVSEIDVVAPPPGPDALAVDVQGKSAPYGYEVQELKVELGQQVNAGEMMSFLSRHQSLYIEGHSFRREAPFLEEAAKKGWPVRVQFDEVDASAWPSLDQNFQIRHLANSIDQANRTFAFYIPLENQFRTYEKDQRTFLVWRFRPGQRVQLWVPVEMMNDVFVLPAPAVVREGPEAFVFKQNGDLFTRQPVQILYEDRESVVLANDGGIRTKVDYIAQSGAATLHRVLKAQSSSGGLPPGAHMHADGTIHMPH